MRPIRLWLALAGLNGALAVGLGAYAAHGMADASPYVQDVMEKATRFQAWHALALAAIAGLQAAGLRSRFFCVAGALMVVGLVFFCGALYAIGLAGWSVAFLAPIGGVSFILGWLSLAVGGLTVKGRSVA